MRINDLFKHNQSQFEDFIEDNKINYDLADDLAFFMNHDDDTYRRHTYPAIVKCLEGIKNKKKTNPTIFKAAALEGYKNYCTQYPIRELPNNLDEKMINEVCKLMHEEVCADHAEGKYKD